MATTRIGFWTWISLWGGAERGLLVSMQEKVNWFHLISLITLVLLMWKWMGLFWIKNNLLRCWGWLSLLNWIGASSKLDCGSFIISIVKSTSKKIGDLILLWSFFLLKFLCVSINLLYGHAWNTVVVSGLVLLVATWDYRTAGSSLATSLELLVNRWNVASLSLFYRYYFCICLSELA